ncbi:MAG: hypothetical protein OEU84_07795 [Xanthomonadales bacterium]|nr:hypothetical protein [Xanthomonadales bacterium]
MSSYYSCLPHDEIREVFPDVFFVTGTYSGDIGGASWRFSRNMTVVRDGNALSLINTVRLDDDGLKALESLGKVTNIIKIGSMHGVDDVFYKNRYDAKFWAMPGMQQELETDVELTADGEMPFSGASVFEFKTTKLPECILRLDREGGIMIACDALQNWLSPDDFFSDESRAMMQEMGFFTKANVGPVWMQFNEPEAEDFQRLKQIPFRHALTGHGEPLLETAHEDYSATFERLFGV